MNTLEKARVEQNIDDFAKFITNLVTGKKIIRDQHCPFCENIINPHF